MGNPRPNQEITKPNQWQVCTSHLQTHYAFNSASLSSLHHNIVFSSDWSTLTGRGPARSTKPLVGGLLWMQRAGYWWHKIAGELMEQSSTSRSTSLSVSFWGHRRPSVYSSIHIRMSLFISLTTSHYIGVSLHIGSIIITKKLSLK